MNITIKNISNEEFPISLFPKFKIKEWESFSIDSGETNYLDKILAIGLSNDQTLDFVSSHIYSNRLDVYFDSEKLNTETIRSIKEFLIKEIGKDFFHVSRNEFNGLNTFIDSTNKKVVIYNENTNEIIKEIEL